DAIDVMRDLQALGYCGKILLISGRDETTLKEIQSVGKSRGLAMLPPLRKPFRPADLVAAVSAQAERYILPRAPSGPSVIVDSAEAFAKGWFELWYQPKIALRSFSLCGAEALLRLRHPEHGILSPASFLPPAGDPLYLPISQFVFERAMTDW